MSKRKRNRRRKSKGSKEWRHYLEVQVQAVAKELPPMTFKQAKQS